MKALLLDMTHGGQVLAPLYQSEGYDVSVCDVYRIAPDEMLDDLRSKGVHVTVGKPEPGHYDLVTMPCHCPDAFLEGCTYNRRVWYSQSVNHFIDDRRFRIEVTGEKGKTTTCYLIAHLLSSAGKKVYLRTSRGSGPYIDNIHRIDELKSIAPPYILDIPEGDYDAIVCEVSLGGSGKADIACITNLLENYGIAKNTRLAEEGKKDILTDKVNIVLPSEEIIWKKYGKPLTTSKKYVKTLNMPKIGEPLEISVDYDGEHRIELDGSFLGLQYIDAIDMALSVCEAMKIPADAVSKGLRSFHGVAGRGEVMVVDGRYHVTERNPGISHVSVRRTLETLRLMGALDHALVIINPVSRKICDKLDCDLIEDVVKEYGVDLMITSGDGNIPEIPTGTGTVILMTKEGYQ